ncbi:MAG: prenyltransferase [Dehalococcoidia bacterium]
MEINEKLFTKIATFPYGILSAVGTDGYPISAATDFRADPARGVIELSRESAAGIGITAGQRVNFIVSHIRPQPGVGYDQRRYVQVWGQLSDAGNALELKPDRAWGWDEAETPFFEYSERSTERGRRYLEGLSKERGVEVKPRLSFGWLALRTTRLPFLSATIIPVLLGIAVAGYHGEFNLWYALVTLVGAAAVHLGLNVANDIFDTLSGADQANVNPTQFSGGSRVVQYGLVSMRNLIVLATVFYAVAIAIGIYLAVARSSTELLLIGVAGVIISVFYTAPPFKLVYRGFGEIAVAVGFGPLMVLGAYVVQTKELAWEPLLASIPVAILIALILYVNEIPDRKGDAIAGKRTLPVRLPADVITNAWLVAAVAAFAVVLVGGVAGWLPWTSLIALLPLPLVPRIYRGIRAYYNSPYELMATMGTNIQLHAAVGLLLFAGYLIALAL